MSQEIDLRIEISVETVIDQIPEVRLWDLQVLALSLEMSGYPDFRKTKL